MQHILHMGAGWGVRECLFSTGLKTSTFALMGKCTRCAGCREEMSKNLHTYYATGKILENRTIIAYKITEINTSSLSNNSLREPF